MRRHRTAVAAVAATLIAATAGLAAVLVVQTKANAELTSANLDLALSNRLTQGANRALVLANERERARFELALEAIKTFHGQVSEDLLLREKQFDGLRTKMLESATDFYQRLEEMLKVQADQRSRAALGEAYHDSGRVNRQDRLARPWHWPRSKRGAELRLALATEPGASPAAIRNAADTGFRQYTVATSTGV